MTKAPTSPSKASAKPKPKPKPKPKCKRCDKTLVPIGDRRKRGTRRHNDWSSRQYHKNVRGYTHVASEEVRLRPSPLAPPPSAFEAATNWEPTSLLGRIASPT